VLELYLPLYKLDAHKHFQMRTETNALDDNPKSPELYVTHDQIRASKIANRSVALHPAKIQHARAPLTLTDRTANKLVAGFIGSPSMSFIPGTVSGGIFRTGEGEEIAVAAGAFNAQAEAGIRPENFTVARDGKGLTLTVEVIEPT